MIDQNAAQHYREQQILNASPAERVVLLYDGAIRFLLLARKAIEENNVQDRHNNNMRAHNVITCLLYTSPSPRDKRQSRMPSSA